MPEYYESAPPSGPPEPARLGVRPLATALWCLGGLLVGAAMAAAAFLGVKVAERRGLDSRKPPAYSEDARIHARGSQDEPLVLAIEQQDLREYYFRESSITGTGLEGIGDGRVFEHRGPLGLRVLGTDSDLIQVEIEEGPRPGERFWMKAPASAEDGGE